MKTALTVSLIALAALAGAVFSSSQSSAVEQGKQVYALQKCGVCHSIGAAPNKVALDGVGSKLKPADIKKWIRTPKEMKADTTMKPYPNLPESDLNALTAYLSGLK